VWNGTIKVAVKVFKSGTLELLHEISFIKQFRHTNIVQVYRVCTREEPIYIVTELMKHGSLLEYLRGDGCSLKFTQLIDMRAQVAAGGLP